MGSPLAPGFLALFIQRSSFADDSENITELWANLLADAARAFSNKHVNYVGILSQLGPAEVTLLDQLIGQHVGPRSRPPSNLHTSVGSLLGNMIGAAPQTPEQASAAVNRVLEAKPYWPGRVLSAEVPYFDMGFAKLYTGGFVSEDWVPISIDLLIRQRLLEEVTVELRDWESPPRARIVLMTGLGLDFVYACRGTNQR